MNNIYKAILITLTIILVMGCYNDKGNYDYIDIPEISILNSGDSIFNTISKIDTIKITPKISTNIGHFDENNYTYKWMIIEGSTIMKGKPVEISTSKELKYFVNLPVNMAGYSIILKIKDKRTNVENSAIWKLNVSNLYSNGIMAWGEDENGYGRLDFISTVKDTIVFTDILENSGLPKLQGPNLVFQGNYFMNNEVHISSDDGSFLLDPNTLVYDEKIDNFRYKITSYETIKSYKIDYIFDPRNHRAIVIDGKLCISEWYSGCIYGFPVNRYIDNIETFDIANELGVNYKLMSFFSKIYVLYDKKNKRFCGNSQSYYWRFAHNYGYESDSLKNKSSDINIFDWNTGLYYVSTFHSFFSTGHTTTILNDKKGKYYAYRYVINRQGPQKIAKYDISDAIEIDKAKNPKLFFASSKHPYIFYAVENKIYGYDLQYGKKSKLIIEFKNKITAIYDAPVKEGGRDNIYVATYDGQNNGGVITKLHITDDPNIMEIKMIQNKQGKKLEWRGFGKIISIWHKNY